MHLDQIVYVRTEYALLANMSRALLAVHGRHGDTQRCLSEIVDGFAISYLLLPLLPLTYNRWEQIVQERYCCFMPCDDVTFAQATLFSTRIINTSDAHFVFQYRCLVTSGLSTLFDRLFGLEKTQKRLCLQLLNQWVKFVRCYNLEAKLV